MPIEKEADADMRIVLPPPPLQRCGVARLEVSFEVLDEFQATVSQKIPLLIHYTRVYMEKPQFTRVYFWNDGKPVLLTKHELERNRENIRWRLVRHLRETFPKTNETAYW